MFIPTIAMLKVAIAEIIAPIGCAFAIPTIELPNLYIVLARPFVVTVASTWEADRMLVDVTCASFVMVVSKTAL